jgi:altronate dehydratase small subunit
VKANVIVINPRDNVAIALEDIAAGARVRLPGGGTLTAVEKIPYSHKVAMVDIDSGQTVYKYGESIGSASAHIGKGSWVHTHNLTEEKGRA